MKRRTMLWAALGTAVCLAIATLVLPQVGKVDAATLIDEATTALARGDVKTAGDRLDQVLSQEPTNAAALIQRGKLWASIGEFDDAVADWRKVDVQGKPVSSSKLVSEARLLEGELQVSRHYSQAAEQALLQAWQVSQNQDRLPALELLLRIYVLQTRHEDIRHILNLIESFRPLSLEEMVLRADAGDLIVAESDAISQLSDFIKADPSDLNSLIALTRYLMASEKYEQAEKLLQAAPQGLSMQSPVLGLRAICQFNLGDTAGAMQTVRRAIGERDYWWWLAVGELAEFKKQPYVAAGCFALACESQPSSGYARYRYGRACHASGQLALSAEQLQIAANIDQLHQHTAAIMRLIELSPRDFVNGLLEIARLQQELNWSADAAGWAKLALQIDAQNKTALQLSQVGADPQTSKGPGTLVAANALREKIDQWLASQTDQVQPQSVTPLLVAKSPLRLEDVQQTAQLDFQYFNGNSGFKYLIEAMGGGVSVLDFDNDGWPDCYFPQGCKFPIDLSDTTYLDQIYRNQQGIRFENVTQFCRIQENGYSQGAATGDLNNDGFADVVVANFGRNRVFINQGDGTFLDLSDAWGLVENEMSSSLALADLDRDGNLDLYVVNYVDEIRICRDPQGNVSTCNPQNFAGVQDRLYQNSGDGAFSDVTKEAGMLTVDGKGLGVVATDLDDDGWVDLYVANDTNANYLFKNLGGMHFQEIGLASGTALSEEGGAQAGMGIAAGDFDGDLQTDLYVTNFYLESNNFYHNAGAMSFHDEAKKARLSLTSKNMLGFGTQAEDMDLDGDLDLIVANGHIDDYTSRGDPWKMPTQLYRNLGNGVFEDCSADGGDYFQQSHLGRAIATLDWNRDGRRDFIVVHQDRPVALLENRTESTGGLTLRLIGRESNRDAIGAKVFFTIDSTANRRDIRGGDGFYSTNDRAIVLPSAASLSSLKVVWPSGKTPTQGSVSGVREVVVIENR